MQEVGFADVIVAIFGGSGSLQTLAENAPDAAPDIVTGVLADKYAKRAQGVARETR